MYDARTYVKGETSAHPVATFPASSFGGRAHSARGARFESSCCFFFLLQQPAAGVEVDYKLRDLRYDINGGNLEIPGIGKSVETPSTPSKAAEGSLPSLQFSSACRRSAFPCWAG